MKQHLGTGLLSWPSYERQSGRYGIIALFRPGQPDQGETGLQGLEWIVPIHDLVGTHGSLTAVFDGQEYDLGSGTFFTERDYATDYIGVKPDEPRDEEWLNVTNMYKVDGMITLKPVELYFQETQAYRHTWNGSHFFYYHQICVNNNPPEVTFDLIALSDVPEKAECDFCYKLVHGPSAYYTTQDSEVEA